MAAASTMYVMDLEAAETAEVALVGGKGANLGALARLPGVRVPAGFCVTTGAFRRAAAAGLAMPDDVAAAIRAALVRHGAGAAYAVRSSATAEDAAGTSFAGLHDTFLEVTGPDAILAHVVRVWASLLTERAVAYRARHGIDASAVAMAVVVQRMVAARASGVLFTADPVSGDRTVTAIEAVPGLGEALVSGRATPDTYTVRDGAVVAATPAGSRTTLTDEQALELATLGRRVEAELGRPQDIEWCRDDDGFALVQARPITTLFPAPAGPDDGRPHVYVSVGHQQMMTDPMRPLGLSIWQLTAKPPMYEAAGRLFVDIAPRLASPGARAAIVEALGTHDPLLGDALRTIVDRGVVPAGPDPALPPPPGTGAPSPVPTDAAIVAGLIADSEASLTRLRQAIAPLSGPALMDFILADIDELKRVIFDPVSSQAIMAGMEAAWWLDERLAAWLGEPGAADVLAQSVDGNITSEMGLALLDVADAIRPFDEVVAFLQEHPGDLDGLAALPGGLAARAALDGFLDRYGVRCIGEIDLTRPRWGEEPAALIPLVLGNINNFAPGEAARRFEQGRQRALAKRRDVLARLRALPDGAVKAQETAAMIDRLRTFSGYREYPKYAIVSRHFVYKQALLGEARRLVATGALRNAEDCFFLRFEELHDVVRGTAVPAGLTAERRKAFDAFGALTPPRVILSTGEIVTGAYRRDDVPEGALAGLAVSAGAVEGRARVILDMADADVAPGDILVTAFTDPSWSPLFVAVTGLVTEVGGQMTHGAVIAREYGLPAVVGVEQATQRIRDGDRIRVDGTRGYVEILA